LRVALPVLSGAQRQQLMSAEKTLAAPSTWSSAAPNHRPPRRGDQDLAAEAETLDKAIIAEVSKAAMRRNVASEQRSKDPLAAVSVERADLRKTFATEFPDYAALSNPLPIPAKGIQALLSVDEAMIVFSVVEDESYAMPSMCCLQSPV
jgi:hypothetical protein